MNSHDATNRSERTPWRVVDALMAFAGGLVAATVAFAIAGAEADVTAVFGLVVPLQAAGMLGVIVLLAPRREPWRAAFRWSARPPDLIGFPMGAGIQIGLAIVFAVLAETVLGIDPPTQEVVDIAAGAVAALDWALVVFGVVILGPLAEEIVFRGIILRALERRGRAAAIYGSSALFALVHLFDPNALFALPLFFVLGVVLARQVLSTGRLGRAFTIHAGFNLMTVIALYIVSVS